MTAGSPLCKFTWDTPGLSRASAGPVVCGCVPPRHCSPWSWAQGSSLAAPGALPVRLTHTMEWRKEAGRSQSGVLVLVLSGKHGVRSWASLHTERVPLLPSRPQRPSVPARRKGPVAVSVGGFVPGARAGVVSLSSDQSNCFPIRPALWTPKSGFGVIIFIGGSVVTDEKTSPATRTVKLSFPSGHPTIKGPREVPPSGCAL